MPQAIALSDRVDLIAKTEVAAKRLSRLVMASRDLAEILEASELCLRLTVHDLTFVIGAVNSAYATPIEFRFESEHEFYSVFKKIRLLNFAKAFLEGQMEIIGDITEAVDILYAVNASIDYRQTQVEYLKLVLFRWLKAVVPPKISSFESLDHYAQNAEAYGLFLDKYMQYTCGYFETGNESIDEAQVAKFKLIRDLGGSLRGKAHLDIGCGWGGLINFFEAEFGTQSIGNTNCEEQLSYIRNRNRKGIIFGDFSTLAKNQDRFHCVTVVGMSEHLTPHRKSQLYRIVYNLLESRGFLYLQCISKPKCWIGGDAYRFVQNEIFPGHYLDYPEDTETRLRDAGFIIEQKIEHASHYALTTARWVERIQSNKAELIRIIGPRQYRAYLGYLAMASKLFEQRGSLMRYIARKP